MAIITKDYTYTIRNISSEEFGMMLTALGDLQDVTKTVNQTKIVKNLIKLFEETASK